MKKISCIQQYVIDSLIKDNKLSIQNLIDATSKVCSEELFNNILSIIINNSNDNSMPAAKEIKANTDNALVRILVCSYKKISTPSKVMAAEILRKYFSMTLSQAKEYIDNSSRVFVPIHQRIRRKYAENLKAELLPYGINIVIIQSP